MPLTEEQIKLIKEQLFQQITHLPEDQQKKTKEFINGMNNEQLESFLIQNKLIKSTDASQPPTTQTPSTAPQPKGKQQCVYCLIAEKAIESLILYEDEKYLAALEINPFSKGHTILIPKKHIKKAKSLPAKALTIANRVGKHIIKKLEAKDFQITTSDEADHAIVNIIPIYKEPLTYQRKPADKQELQKLAIQIGEIKKRKKPIKLKKDKTPIKTTKKSDKINKALIRLQRRIP